MPLNSATSVPGRIGRNRSASRAVSVLRGSATITFICGLARRAASSRRYRIGMRISRIGADDEHHLGQVDILVAGRRRIGAQRLLVAGHRAGHAQARIGIDIVGADQALGELVEDVVILGQQLAGNVEADAVRAMLGDGIGEFFRHEIEAGIPGGALARGIALRAQFRMKRARLLLQQGAGRQVQRAALGAQAAEVGRVLGIALHAQHLPAVGFDDHAAAHAAVAAGRPGLPEFAHAAFASCASAFSSFTSR